MKQTFYLHGWSNGDVLISRGTIGTITLDVEPIRKEVEKVIENPNIGLDGFGGYRITSSLPNNAYNIKVTYTVKE
jgi:hypothetical protein